MLLIFYGTCTYSDIRENVGKVTVVFRIKHFICTGETTFLDGVDVHLTDGNQTGKHIRSFFRIWLVNHTLVTFACCTWFICINSRNDQNFIFDFFLNFAETEKIVTYSIFVVRRTRSDDGKKFIGFPGKNITDFLISF